MLFIPQIKNFGSIIDSWSTTDLITNCPQDILFQQTEPVNIENQENKILIMRCRRPIFKSASSKPKW